ncbi:DNA mismatch repair endonuclease MutL [Desulfitibacter alkalitolerans]|uniref:DNA mismatch repair endonuclease MutL n=1 Tax=Desulfitibacter alkalitolerans TaxID=264641 RepID=UPI000555A205|nr:DNA mismatch repair endonuclease MutL [Desulfitibacter alkalitolerans]
MSLCQIRILDAATANKIAAGEVIERPASVVKELIENAIDAGAKNISVEIFQGGINEIIVTDDGQGIPGDQIKVAFKRHATSKIRMADDLFSIKTYGFRGEALPSIASVSRVTVVTRTAEDHLGSRYIIEGGLDVLFEETACNTGTCIAVKDLFFNVSPRKKQLKSITKEAGYVAHVVAAMALGNPHISFKYSHNKKLIFQSAGKGVLENNIVNVLGIDLFKNLIPVKHGNFDNDEGLNIGGYISKPQYTRSGNHNQYLFVNKRWVYSTIINRAVTKAYTTLIPSERYPIYILSLNIPYHIVDVNVHPTKKQIKFDNDELVEDFVLRALRSALMSLDSIFVQKPKIQRNTFKEIGRQVEFNWETIGIKADEKNYKEKNSTELDFNKIRETKIAYNEYRNNEINEINEETPPCTKNLVENSNESNDITLKVSYPKLKPLEQIDGSYIIAVDGQQKGFYLIDQHAAHERIHYDSLKHARDKDSIKSQLLLHSQVIDLTPAEKDFLLENMLLLQNAGFTLEYFGDNTFLLRGVPVGLESGAGVSVIKDMLDNYLKQNEKPSWARLIKMVACKAAITAKKILSKDEMESLLEKLSKTDVPYTCPHGRPTTVHITDEELIKRFHR